MDNCLYTFDNLDVMVGMNSESVDLIYLDPPFNSKRTYSAPIGTKAAGASFTDMWTWEADIDEATLDTLYIKHPSLISFIDILEQLHSSAMKAYVTYMAQRLIEMKRLLKSKGSIWLHCDPTASHYLKSAMDCIFGEDNFRNEVIWGYRTGGISKNWFPRKHDVLLCYGKSPTKRKVTTHNPPVERIYYSSNFMNTCKLDEQKRWYADVYLRDVWDDDKVKPLINTSRERTGYPTQKPLSLLHRIITTASNRGDVILDPFCGCATTCVAAQQLNRKWIGIDIEKKSAQVLIDRLTQDAGFLSNFYHFESPPSRTDISLIKPASAKPDLFSNQQGKCAGCKTDTRWELLEVDHIFPKSRGGMDHVENLQLLCGNCNRIKGDRPMKYLKKRLFQTRALLERSSY